MKRGIGAGSVLVRVAVLVVGALAVAVVLSGSRPVEGPGENSAGLVDRRAEDARPWSVHVSGWYIEVDGVAVSAEDWSPYPVEDAPGSPYGHLIGKYAEAAGIDWRFVLAIIFEESRFRPDAESRAGAYGLMQVRPIAARQVGESGFREPEANIRTGVRYLQHLTHLFAGARGRDRLALVLAAYNMGPSHVRDAQGLARRYGLDPLVWDGSMSVMVKLLEQPQVFEQLPHGYARGAHVVAYVERVLSRFDSYRRRLASVPPTRAPW